MSKEYDIYLKEHIKNVSKAMDWMRNREIIPEFIEDGWPFSWRGIGIAHDESKYSREEYNAYDDYFYGKEGKDEEDILVIDEAFDYAWLHHIHANPHHWQHWVLIEGEGKIKALEMPNVYVYEMIADWWSFSWKTGNLREIFDWYEKHREKIQLHPETRKLVEKTLKAIEWELDQEEKAESSNAT